MLVFYMHKAYYFVRVFEKFYITAGQKLIRPLPYKTHRDKMPTYILELCPTPAGREFYEKGVRWSADDAGVDLFVVDNSVLKRYENTLLPLGVSARLINQESGEDSHYQLVPRSSIFKSGVIMANSVGIIDKGYRGELKAPVIAFAETATISAGMRLFQIISPTMEPITEVRIVNSLPETARGSGGFGSTGSS